MNSIALTFVMLAAGGILSYAVIYLLFNVGWLTRECGKCGTNVLVHVNGQRFTDGDSMTVLCDKCSLEEIDETKRQIANEYHTEAS